jgi:hypothetical protein
MEQIDPFSKKVSDFADALLDFVKEVKEAITTSGVSDSANQSFLMNKPLAQLDHRLEHIKNLSATEQGDDALYRLVMLEKAIEVFRAKLPRF